MILIGTPVYQKLKASKKPVRCLEGGSRSSKTTSIVQFFVTHLQECKDPKRITIARRRLTWLKMTTFETFEKVFRELGIWNRDNLNKTEMTYKFGIHTFRFIGLDEVQKVHGMEQEILWLNEAIEVDEDDFDQLEQRTSDLVIVDYNPRTLKHWIYNVADNRPDAEKILSTIFDNPFAPAKQRQKILSYEPTPENISHGTANLNKWRIYGLGLRGQVEGLVFPDYTTSTSWPSVHKWKVKGLDFGFTNDPSALIDICFFEGKIFLREMIYQAGLNNLDLSQKFLELGVSKSEDIVADPASPVSIDELRKLYGYNVIKAVKGQGSVISGLDTMNQFPICVHADSLNLINEFDNYTYKKDRKTGLFLNVIEDGQDDHGIDAARYGITHRVGKPKRKKKMKVFGR